MLVSLSYRPELDQISKHALYMGKVYREDQQKFEYLAAQTVSLAILVQTSTEGLAVLLGILR